MSGKRPAEALDPPQKKRSRFGPAVVPQNGLQAPPQTAAAVQNGSTAPPGISGIKSELHARTEALKAKLQALKEKKAADALNKAAASGANARPFGLGGVPITATAARPGPLRLDEHGREVDAQGNVIQRPKETTASLRVNQRKTDLAAKAVDKGKAIRPEDFFDATLSESSSKRTGRQRKGFDFVKAGTFQKEAEQRRLKEAFGDQAVREQREKRENERKAATQQPGDPNLIPLGTRVVATKAEEPLEEIPEVEWWDAGLLQNKAYEIVDEEISNLREDKVTIYVEHPIPLDPPAEEPQPPPMPLPLTTKERKKLRTQRRLEKEKEKQELIRQGLLEPPKPKLKLSTFHRSMGVEASADPTAVEAQVRADQDARLQAHEDRNLANKLTPAERRDKKIKKLTGAATEGEATPVSLYRVSSRTTPQQNFKIRANAEELHMTGCAVLTDALAVIVVEGGYKAQKKYAHIVLNRIRWEQAGGNEEDNDEGGIRAVCSKAWTGTIKTPAFDKFVVETCRTEAAARKFLADRALEHYWDLAKGDLRD